METFSVLLAFCARNSPVTGKFPAQRPVTRSFDVFFDLRLNRRLNKQSLGWWFEMLWRPSWRHCNGSSISNCGCNYLSLWHTSPLLHMNLIKLRQVTNLTQWSSLNVIIVARTCSSTFYGQNCIRIRTCCYETKSPYPKQSFMAPWGVPRPQRLLNSTEA